MFHPQPLLARIQEILTLSVTWLLFAQSVFSCRSRNRRLRIAPRRRIPLNPPVQPETEVRCLTSIRNTDHRSRQSQASGTRIIAAASVAIYHSAPPISPLQKKLPEARREGHSASFSQTSIVTYQLTLFPEAILSGQYVFSGLFRAISKRIQARPLIPNLLLSNLIDAVPWWHLQPKLPDRHCGVD